jgi:transposase-like protein
MNDGTRKCPKCGSADLWDKIRSYDELKGVIDMGWKCRRCHYEFGFELSESSYAHEPVIKRALAIARCRESLRTL